MIMLLFLRYQTQCNIPTTTKAKLPAIVNPKV